MMDYAGPAHVDYGMLKFVSRKKYILDVRDDFITVRHEKRYAHRGKCYYKKTGAGMEYKFRIGTDDFKKLRDDGGYFIDKTLFIKEIIDGNDVILIPRPRRFGKTLNMTMLRYFFENSEESRSYLFEGCAITDLPEYMQHQGQYPVIYISLEGVAQLRIRHNIFC